MLQTLTTLQDAQNMYQWFIKMRTEQPVWLDTKSSCWHLFRYEDVVRVTTDNAVFSSEQPLDGDANQASSLPNMDPPRHCQYRNLISSTFTPRSLAPLSERIVALVQEAFDRVRPKGRMDFIADLASPLPALVIADILGLPGTDRVRFQHWADALFSDQMSDEEWFNPAKEGESHPARQRADAASEEMNAFFEQMLAERRSQPGEDLLSFLLAAEIEGEQLSQDDMLAFCTLLLLTGHVTTTHLLGQALLCLDSHPAAMRQLRECPELIASAIEEVLRYASPVWRVMRITREAVELSGVRIPANAILFAWLASANRDEAQFPHPECFDIARTPNHHVAFGRGIHFCLGAPLARMEALIALPMLLAQFPDLRVVRDQPLELLRSHILFGVKALPVTF